MNEGLFIVLEGIEGAGKSTQASHLLDWMREQGIRSSLAREPGGTAVGEAIREIVLDKGSLIMPPETELFLILAARAAFVREVVGPALARGEVFVADRFDLSTFAYQGFGRGLELDAVRRANNLATGGLHPNLYLVLDLPVQSGLARKGEAGPEDRIEREGVAFLSRVREGYKTLASTEPRVRSVDADAPAEEVQAAIRELLVRTFPETFRGRGV